MPDDAPGRGLGDDARFVLANERTLLAWIRTSLTLVAAGVAVEQLATDVRGRTLLAALLLASGLITVVVGAFRHRAADLAVRSGRLPRTGVVPYALVAAVAGTAVVALVVILLG